MSAHQCNLRKHERGMMIEDRNPWMLISSAQISRSKITGTQYVMIAFAFARFTKIHPLPIINT